MGSVIRPLRFLGKNRKVTAISVLSLSIAIALAVVSLSFSNTFLVLPPAGVEPKKLVTIYSHAPDDPIGEISYPDYRYFRENNSVFTDIAAAPNSISVNFQTDERGEVRVVSRPVSDNYFAVLGIRPFLGRLLVSGDDLSNPPVAVMTYACWKRLGSDPNVIGKQIAGHTIVGVAPKDFTGSLYGLDGDLVRSLSGSENTKEWMSQRDARRLILTARLKPGVSRRQAQTEMTALAARLAAVYPKEDKNRTTVVARASLLPPGAITDAERAAAIAMALVLLVLLIACANVANLLLAVAMGRRQEAAIKLALGAPRGRLIREFLKESSIICAAGGALGYAIAAFAIARYPNISVPLPMYGSYSIGLNLRLDSTVIAATLTLVGIATFATGLAPGFYASSPRLASMLSGEIVVGGTRKNARRNALVIVQIAVCTLVLVGMGLCQREIYNLRHVDTGFSARNLVADTIYPKNEGFSDDRGKRLYEDLSREVSALPGVESVTLASHLPLAIDGGESEIPVQSPAGGNKISIGEAVVDDRYFGALDMRVLTGRGFDSGDREGGADVIVVNRKMAEMFWPGRDPIGKTVFIGDPARAATVVGVAANGKYGSLDEEVKPYLYAALTQHYRGAMNVIVRTRGDPRLWAEPLARTVHTLGINAPILPATYDDWMGVTLLPERIAAACVAVLSGLALLLALVGLSGAIAHSVSARKKELGIRVALGAQRRQLMKMILRHTFFVAGAGIAAGILAGVGGTVLLRSQFFGISVVEWTVLIPVTVGMLAISLAVAYASARPWIAVNPMETVRHA